jgi:hypothetical protein
MTPEGRNSPLPDNGSPNTYSRDNECATTAESRNRPLLENGSPKTNIRGNGYTEYNWRTVRGSGLSSVRLEL